MIPRIVFAMSVCIAASAQAAEIDQRRAGVLIQK